MTAPALSITPAEREQIEKAATPLITAARACTVTNAAEYRTAASQLQKIKGAQKQLAERKKTIMDPLKAAVKAANTLFAPPENELDEAEGLYKRQMLAHDDEQDRLRRAEQKKLDDAAEAERKRKAEQAAKADADAKAAREAGNTARAEKLEAKAETLSDQVHAIVAPIAQREVPSVKGISTRELWSAVVMGTGDLVLAVAAQLIRERFYPFAVGTIESPAEILAQLLRAPVVPLEALEPNMKFLNNQAKALKRNLNYPGVRAVVDKSLAAGSN
jgi:hypothetical protein